MMTRSDWLMAALCAAWTTAWAAESGNLFFVAHALAQDSAPAWVQAIGSVAAIVAAVIVSNQTARRTRHIALEIQNREAASRIEVAIHIANQARTLVNMANDRVSRHGEVTLGAGDFDSVRGAIDALPIADLRSGRLVTCMMTIRRLLGPIQKISEDYESVGGHGVEPTSQKAFDERMAVRLAAFDRTHEDLQLAARAALDRLSESHAQPPPG